jgi:hypothetical protein
LAGGEKKVFKTLATECVIVKGDGEEIITGALNTKVGEENNPIFFGLEQQVGGNVFSASEESMCKKVWGGLVSYPELTKDINDFFTQGTVSQAWVVNDGVLDLTDKLILYQTLGN